jgi:dipeptidyl aminopeptidase/acylaminoacyl peptidase
MHLYIKDLPSLAGRLAARSGGSGEPIGEPSAPVRLAASAPPPNDCASSGSDCSSSVGGDECEAEDAARTVPGTLRRITAGESELWMTEDIVHVDEERELVFFSSTFGGPLERQLCVASFRAGARPTDVHQLTEQGFTHSAFAFHPSGRRFCATFSSRHVPHQSAVYDVAGLSTGTPAAIRIVEVARLANPASKAPFAIQPPEIFDFLADDGRTRLYGALYKPSKVHPTDPDPGRGPHATVLSVYGGPGVQTVRNEWELTMQLKHQLMANHRYAVVMIDGRGSARRGVEFESVFADVGFGAVELRDQVRGIEHLVARGVVDPARVGCSGWSYGAYASCMLLAKYSHLFLFAVCGAAVVRFEEYSAAYSERFLGKPSENPPAYASSSVLSHVQSLPDREGRLMLIHAVLDENVHCAQTLELVSALVKLNKPHSLVLYPKERHGLRAASAQLHFESTFFRFVDNALSRVAT